MAGKHEHSRARIALWEGKSAHEAFPGLHAVGGHAVGLLSQPARESDLNRFVRVLEVLQHVQSVSDEWPAKSQALQIARRCARDVGGP